MRKSVLAAALAAAFPVAALAQAGSVEAYGIVDIGFERVDVGSVTSNRFSSGISAGSRFGLRGREPLGAGYSALFTLEARLEADTGSLGNRGPIYYCGPGLCPGIAVIPPATILPPANQAAIVGGSSAVNAALLSAVTTVNGVNALWDRQSFAGVITPFGALLLGRQYTPGYEVLNKYNSFADATAGQMGQGYSALAIRANNALQWRAELSGFTASVMYGFGGTDGNRNERGAAPTKADDFIGLNLQYNTPNFGVGVGHNRNYTATYAEPTRTQTGLTTTNAGACFGIGNSLKLFVQYMQRENDRPVLRPEDVQAIVIATGGNLAAINGILGGLYLNPFDMDLVRGVAGATDTKIYHLGAQWTVSGGTWHFAYNNAKDTARTPWAREDAKVNHYGVAYFHNMSRRTQLFGAFSLATNDGDARMGVGAAGYSGGFTTSRGQSGNAIQAGIRHSF